MSAVERFDYKKLFLQDIPLIDVRAPIEFTQGAFPLAVNAPIMSDDERTQVGTCYKKNGKDAAFELAYRLVSGDVLQARMESWIFLCQQSPQGYLYCLRGGMRSHQTQKWLKQAGIDYPLVPGGYKALRNTLLKANQTAAQFPLMLIGGNTGSGKTILIKTLNNGIDLEGIANHRGSSFGRKLTPQSGQIDFENKLAITFLKKRGQEINGWVMEDEGRMIGSNHLPLELYRAMENAPLAVIEEPFEQRLERLLNEYIIQMKNDFEKQFGVEQGWQEYNNYLQQGIYTIRKRLGQVRYLQLVDSINNALEKHRQTDNAACHLDWLTILLKEYYDPMYSYQLNKKSERIIFRGDYHQVQAFFCQTTFQPDNDY